MLKDDVFNVVCSPFESGDVPTCNINYYIYITHVGANGTRLPTMDLKGNATLKNIWLKMNIYV